MVFVWWWWWWLLFVVVVLLLPLGYGWGYRGWGPPYPSRFRRRTPPGASPAADRAGGTYEPVDPEEGPGGWGLLADLLWLMVVVALVWLVIALVVW